MLQIQPITHTEPVHIAPHTVDHYDWMRYFDTTAAMRSVAAHIAGLPSSRRPERTTSRVYEAGLKYFLAWATDQPRTNIARADLRQLLAQPLPLPTEQVILDYIAHLSLRGLAAATIRSKYLAPLRIFLNALAKQFVTGITGDLRDRIEDYRHAIRAAATVKAPKDADSSNLPALERHGYRMSLAQINDLFAYLKADDSVRGLRNLAIIYTGIASALRVSEMARITLDSIRPGEGCYQVSVRGKRGQVDPVAIDDTAYRLIHAYVDAWNEQVGADDPRYIYPDTPIWQPLHGSVPLPVGFRIGGKAYATQKDEAGRTILPGIKTNTLWSMICNQTHAAIGVKVTPHDLRRTYAKLAYEKGVPLANIQRQLRHANLATTSKYIGNTTPLKLGLISNRVQFNV